MQKKPNTKKKYKVVGARGSRFLEIKILRRCGHYGRDDLIGLASPKNLSQIGTSVLPSCRGRQVVTGDHSGYGAKTLHFVTAVGHTVISTDSFALREGIFRYFRS